MPAGEHVSAIKQKKEEAALTLYSPLISFLFKSFRELLTHDTKFKVIALIIFRLVLATVSLRLYIFKAPFRSQLVTLNLFFFFFFKLLR